MAITTTFTHKIDTLLGPCPWRDMLFACGCSLVLFGVSPAIHSLLLLLIASLQPDALDTVYELVLQLYEVGTLVVSVFAFGVGLAVLFVANHQLNCYHRDRLSPLLWQDVRATKVALRAVVVACAGQLVRRQAFRNSECHQDGTAESPFSLATVECLVFHPSDSLLVVLVASASLTLLSLARCIKLPPQTLLPTTATRRQPRAFTLASAA